MYSKEESVTKIKKQVYENKENETKIKEQSYFNKDIISMIF